jgi:hypothetical protein
LGDPADEIAYLLDQNDLSPEQREAFFGVDTKKASELKSR